MTQEALAPATQRLRYYLEREGLNPSQATDQWSVAGGYLHRILRGTRPISRELIVRVAGCLALPPAELLAWLEEETLGWLYQTGYRAPSILGDLASRQHPGKCVLTFDQIEEARWLHDHEGWSYARIAPHFCVSAATVHRAVHRDDYLKAEAVVCGGCGQRFMARHGRKYCGRKCMQNVVDRRYRQRHREQRNQRNRDWRARQRSTGGNEGGVR